MTERDPPSDAPQSGDDPTHTSDPSGAAALAPGGLRTWGPFQLLESLGHGGFGRVYRAWEATLAREVALKIIRAPNAEQASTVLHEGRLLARVRHPNVVTVHGAQQVGDEIGIWMDLIRGRSLADLIKQQGPMSADEAAVVGVHLCQALAAVHAAGLLHRDIKAQNVMRESGGRIVLMDFGAGRELEDPEHSGRAELPGTPKYMAPELFTGHSASRASDIYSLGVLLYFLVTREFPVDGRTVMDFALAHSDRRRRSLADVRPDLPPAFVRTLERALAPAPADRYRSAGAMLQALADAMPGSTTVRIEPPPPRPEITPEPQTADARAGRLAPWHRWTIGLASAVLIVGFIGFVASAAFNLWLGISPDFATEGPLDWWITGLRSLIPLAVYFVFFMIVMRVGAALWHIVERILPPAMRLRDRSRMTITSVLERLGGPDARSAGHELLLVQVVALAVLSWVFFDMLSVLMSDLNTVSAASLEPLREGHPKRWGYRFTLLAVTIAMSAAWFSLWRRQRARGYRLDRTTLAAGLGLIAVVLMMLQAPYALLFRQVPRVNFEDQGAKLRCYQVGANAASLLLYCPDAPPPRSHVVPKGDRRLELVAQPIPLFSPDPAR